MGLYFGLVGLLVLYGFVFSSISGAALPIYTGLTGAQLIWLMGESGLLYHYIFFGWPQAMNLVMVIALTCIAFLGFKLDEIFLRRSLKPYENQILKRCKQLSLVCVILSIIMPYGTAVRMAVGLQMLYMSVSFWLALVSHSGRPLVSFRNVLRRICRALITIHEGLLDALSPGLWWAWVHSRC